MVYNIEIDEACALELFRVCAKEEKTPAQAIARLLASDKPVDVRYLHDVACSFFRKEGYQEMAEGHFIKEGRTHYLAVEKGDACVFLGICELEEGKPLNARSLKNMIVLSSKDGVTSAAKSLIDLEEILHTYAANAEEFSVYE